VHQHHGVTRWQRSITSLWPSATSTTQGAAEHGGVLGRYEPAVTIAGFAALNPLTAAAFPELGTALAHLRDVLGDKNYESLAHKGEAMTTAGMVAYAYDQIDHARTELNAVSK
jgi:hypothetical protein